METGNNIKYMISKLLKAKNQLASNNNSIYDGNAS